MEKCLQNDILTSCKGGTASERKKHRKEEVKRHQNLASGRGGNKCFFLPFVGLIICICQHVGLHSYHGSSLRSDGMYRPSVSSVVGGGPSSISSASYNMEFPPSTVGSVTGRGSSVSGRGSSRGRSQPNLGRGRGAEF